MGDMLKNKTDEPIAIGKDPSIQNTQNIKDTFYTDLK